MLCFQAKNGQGHDPDALQRGMVGNVTTYVINTPQVSDMLQGKLLPHRPDVLASVIAVAFIGRGNVPKNWLKSTFQVWRQVVLEALIWLWANNPLYQHISLSQEHVDSLPVDDVPEAIVGSLQCESNPVLVAQERASYVLEVEDESVDELQQGQHTFDHMMT
ncbi:hypothetical protein JB92DRAFT_2825918 [Gautieria morchelliformis]|nr:hypothetical protein JB92DRAFT_2825918 [Gautieria morchelliformis]